MDQTEAALDRKSSEYIRTIHEGLRYLMDEISLPERIKYYDQYACSKWAPVTKVMVDI